jgi:uridine kinase
MSETRARVIATIASEVRAAAPVSFSRVAVDGVDGAGKTFFADELAAELCRAGRPVVRVSVDGFHNPREVRYRRGRSDPEGFFRDSYDYDRLISLVLEPLSPNGSGTYAPAAYDIVAERPVAPVTVQAPAGAILIIDGIFLHRDELAVYWDYSIWLDVPFDVSIPRGAQRGPGFGHADPAHPSNQRYVEGQRIYIRECLPEQRATVILDNTVLETPILDLRGSELDTPSWLVFGINGLEKTKDLSICCGLAGCGEACRGVSAHRRTEDGGGRFNRD